MTLVAACKTFTKLFYFFYLHKHKKQVYYYYTLISKALLVLPHLAVWPGLTSAIVVAVSLLGVLCPAIIYKSFITPLQASRPIRVAVLLLSPALAAGAYIIVRGSCHVQCHEKAVL
jgi:hypothetical protein